MNILDQIVAHKQKEVAENKSLYPLKLLEQSKFFDSETVSMCHYLKREDKSGIIAEFKRKSPSKGVINAYADVAKVTVGYMQAGASGLSVLTDKTYFGGTDKDLQTARLNNYCPILRKDFIIDEYQIIETKSIGADVVLLIAAALTPEKTATLAAEAKKLGLEVLLEVHNQAELNSHFNTFVDMVGVNNRNLQTFEVSLETSLALADKIPAGVVKISESGISQPESIHTLRKAGYHGFLMGENFMKNSRPHKAAAQFIDTLDHIPAAT